NQPQKGTKNTKEDASSFVFLCLFVADSFPFPLHQLSHDLLEIIFTRLCSFLRECCQWVVSHIKKRHEVRLLLVDINQTGQELIRVLALSQSSQGFRLVRWIVTLISLPEADMRTVVQFDVFDLAFRVIHRDLLKEWNV